MAHYFVTKDGYYYSTNPNFPDTEDLPSNPTDIEVTERPTLSHVWDFGGGSWSLDTNKRWDYLRKERDFLLSQTDKFMLSDFPIDTNEKNDWIAYRKSLRDFPQSIQDITAPIIWPTIPTSSYELEPYDLSGLY